MLAQCHTPHLYGGQELCRIFHSGRYTSPVPSVAKALKSQGLKI